MLGMPDLSDALGKLDTTAEQMTEMTESLTKVVSLLEQQNDLLLRICESKGLA